MRFLSILLIVIAASCGHDRDTKGEPGAKAAPAKNPDTGHKPCDYMARADAETAIELKLPGTTEHVPDSCLYSTSEFYGASLTLGDWDSIKKASSTAHPKPVEGVGDEALFIGGGTIYVRKGDRGFLLVINGPVVDHSADKGLAKASALAVTIAAKM
jgi:hypothetical protein